MSHIPALVAFNLVLTVLSGIGLCYLLYSELFVVGYRRFLVVMTVGLLLFVVGGPIFLLFAPDYVHFVHGVSALLVILGLYDPVRHDLRHDEWAWLLLEDPSTMRSPGDWMVPMDDRILELFHGGDLVLTPALIAHNIGHSREAVNRRLSELEAHGFVDRVERGKYRISPLGERYLVGESPDPADDQAEVVAEMTKSA